MVLRDDHPNYDVPKKDDVIYARVGRGHDEKWITVKSEEQAQ